MEKLTKYPLFSWKSWTIPLFVSIEMESIELFLRDDDDIIKSMANITRESRDFRKSRQKNVAYWDDKYGNFGLFGILKS